MNPVFKVIVVDDSAVVRGLLNSLLNEEPDIEVVATPANGRIALEKIERFDPDLVVLDIEMPVMDGLTTLVEIRKRWTKLPVVMFSALTERGASATIDALSKGASDWATKPGQSAGLAKSRDHVRTELVAKIRALLTSRHTARTSRPLTQATKIRTPMATSPIDAVVFGCSTGGPVALDTVLTSISPALDVPMFVVQHMPRRFTAALAERLDRKAAYHVVEAMDGTTPEPGTCYIAPGGRHLHVEGRSADRAEVRLSDGPLVNSCRPAVDVLFRSAAATYGPNTLAVVLTGMGSDGALGVKELAAHDASVIAQDEDSCVVYGMPRAVAELGLATEVLPLAEIGPRIVEIVTRSAIGPEVVASGGAL